jgi:hypothetical protein
MAKQVWLSDDGVEFQTQAAAEEHDKDCARQKEMAKLLTKMYNNMDKNSQNKYYELLDDSAMREVLADFLIMTDVAVMANELIP